MHPFNFYYLSEAGLTSPLAKFIDDGESAEIIKDGKRVAVLISIEDYEDLVDALEATAIDGCHPYAELADESARHDPPAIFR